MAEISPAEVREVRKRFKAILVANLGYGKLCHDKGRYECLGICVSASIDKQALKRILEDTAEGGYAVASPIGRRSPRLSPSGSSASRNTGNCGYTGKSGRKKAASSLMG